MGWGGGGVEGISLPVIKELSPHMSFLLTQRSDCGLYKQIGDHSS